MYLYSSLSFICTVPVVGRYNMNMTTGTVPTSMKEGVQLENWNQNLCAVQKCAILSMLCF